MDAQYWHQKWAEEKIGFHQDVINKRLISYWSQLSPSTQAADKRNCVFVPLCGKSLDMLWLHEQGHHVLGVELSEKAAQAFFNDNHLDVEPRTDGQFTIYSGVGHADGITIMVGDFFALTPEQCKFCVAFYDRAAMIAMAPDMRKRYAHQLAALMPVDSMGLLLTISYDQKLMQGPPFSVTDENVQELLDNTFNINELARYTGPERLGNLKERGLETLDERVYLLQRKAYP
ncbi:MAG: thiopurine S-methyltransferase [Granulosicoccus sp.]